MPAGVSETVRGLARAAGPSLARVVDVLSTQVNGLAIGWWFLLVAAVAAGGLAVGAAISRRGGPRELLGRVLLRILGPRDRQGFRLLGITIFALVALLLLVVYVIARYNLRLTGESGPILRTIIKLGLSTEMYAVLAVLSAAAVRYTLYDRLAAMTADELHFSKAAIKQYAAEIRSTYGTVALYGNSDHAEPELKAKLLRAFADQADHELPESASAGTNGVAGALEGEPEAALPASAADVEVPEDADAGAGFTRSESLEAAAFRKLEALDTDIDRLTAAIDTHLGDVLTADLDPTRADPDDDLVAPADLLDEDAQSDLAAAEQLEARANRLVAEYNALLQAWEQGTLTEYFLLTRGTRSDLGTAVRTGAALADALDLSATSTADATAATETVTESVSDGDTADDSGPTAAERAVKTLRSLRLQVAATLNFEDLAYRFALPGAAAFIAAVAIFETVAFQAVGYAMLVGGAALFGSLYYTQHQYRMRRRARNARQTTERESWGEVLTLAKRVPVDGGPDAYIAFMGGRVYFDLDKGRLATTVANRWHQRINGTSVAPAQQEQWARDARQMLPCVDLLEWHDEEYSRGAIYDEMIREVYNAENPRGLVPKYELGERVSTRAPEVNYDPDVLGECYRDLHGIALAETDVPVRAGDGSMGTVTVVHLRTHPLSDDPERIRAQFSGDFSPDNTAKFPLPDVGGHASVFDPALSPSEQTGTWTTSPESV